GSVEPLSCTTRPLLRDPTAHRRLCHTSSQDSLVHLRLRGPRPFGTSTPPSRHHAESHQPFRTSSQVWMALPDLRGRPPANTNRRLGPNLSKLHRHSDTSRQD